MYKTVFANPILYIYIYIWSISIETIIHSYLVSQRFEPEYSVEAINGFLLYGSTTVTCRNTLLTILMMISVSFHKLKFLVTVNTIAFLFGVQLVTYYAKWKKPLENKFWHILSTYYTTLMNLKKIKNGIIGYIPQKTS